MVSRSLGSEPGGACTSRLFQLSGTYHRSTGLSLSKIVNLLPPASVNTRIGLPFLVLDMVDSTNNYAMGQLHAGLAKHGQAYFATHQFAGKGQRGRTWNANAGENITVTIILDATFPNNHYPFLLSASVALSCIDLLNDLRLSETRIKWPNDIYWRDRKAGGILIENIYHGNEWKYAVVGIGLNVKQTSFLFDKATAVSLKQITGSNYDPVTLAKELCSKLDARYAQLFTRNPDEIVQEFNMHLYKKGKQVKLKKANIIFDSCVEAVDFCGRLVTKDSLERSFSIGEVEWLATD
jgi:BirA family biotin operon repressor/biotin-[acetyl-CoA-carboxylase] ligase